MTAWLNGCVEDTRRDVRRHEWRPSPFSREGDAELLVITPGRYTPHDQEGATFSLLVAKTGELLAQHFCSNSSFAVHDLFERRASLRASLRDRFGDVEVKFLDQTNLTADELAARNLNWARPTSNK